MLRQYELVDLVKSYDPNVDEDALNRAYVFAMKAHGSQKRASGDPYFSHPLEVAGILCEMKLDTATIITALLHDTVEDTDVTTEDIEKHFGKEIADLVNGVTKLAQIKWQSSTVKQAENFRKLLLAMSNDIRVLLVKLADRIHNMRTLHFIESEEKRKRIARETVEIYAPLAERLGIMSFKDELEDISFGILNPDARSSILSRMKFLEKQDGHDIIEPIIKELTEVLEASEVKAQVSGRIKKPYSIWRKMRQKNVALEQLLDIMAFRITVDDIGDCYKALGVLHSHYSVIPGRFKDYISTPKLNDYQSLHTGIIGPLNHRIEVQIRTTQMHEIAELGVAAHWRYKQHDDASKSKTGSGKERDEGSQYRWLRSLLEILETASGPEEFLEHTKLEMFQDQVFCFTPAGDLISLPQGSTPIDFAYEIHSQVGNHCVAAKINGRMAPLRTILKNGDQIEITTSKSQNPSPSWERFVVTGKARANIRKFVRTQKHEQYAQLGKSILNKAFEHENLAFTEKALEKTLNGLHIQSLDDLYAQIGEGLRNSYDVLKAVYPDYTVNKKRTLDDVEVPDGQPVWKDSKTAVSIRGLIPGMAVHYAGCCHPLPGDRIVGIIMSGRGVTIHTYDCDMLKNFMNEPERWIDVAWEDQKVEDRHVGRLHVVLDNRQGALANLTTAISKNGGNIINFKVTNRTENFFELNIDIEVKGADHLTEIMAALRASPLVNTVDRAR